VPGHESFEINDLRARMARRWMIPGRLGVRFSDACQLERLVTLQVPQLHHTMGNLMLIAASCELGHIHESKVNAKTH